jgi:hypothetical protein
MDDARRAPSGSAYLIVTLYLSSLAGGNTYWLLYPYVQAMST